MDTGAHECTLGCGGDNMNRSNVNMCAAVDAVRPAKRARLQPQQERKMVVLDIEGTVSTLSFVADVMFPYALKNAKQHLTQKYNDAETQRDIQSIREQVQKDRYCRRDGTVVAGPVLFYACVYCIENGCL